MLPWLAKPKIKEAEDLLANINHIEKFACKKSLGNVFYSMNKFEKDLDDLVKMRTTKPFFTDKFFPIDSLKQEGLAVLQKIKNKSCE